MKKRGLALLSCVALVCSVCNHASAQQNEDEQISRNMVATMEDARNSKAGNPHELAMEKATPGKVLAELKKYANHPDKKVRARTFDLAWRVLKRSAERGTRQQALRHMLSIVVSDPDPLTARSSSESLVARAALDLRAADFTGEMRQWIHGMVQQKHPYPADLLLAGIADVQSAKPRLNELAREPALPGQTGWTNEKWAAHLALARMGDAAATRLCIQKVAGVTSEVQRVTLALQDIAYIRQPEAVAVLVEYLFSEKRLPSLDGEPGGKYAQRALEHLTEMLEDFPVKNKEFGYSNADIEQARQWITQQGGAAKLKIKR